MKQTAHTPLMHQYFAIKQQHDEALLLFQVGDFFELFFDDAKKAASVLGIALTTRGKNKGEPIPLCGVPLHAKDHYVPKLIRAGFKVAICEQLEPPQPGTVVKRGVTQVLTPGTLTDETLLDEKSASYLFSFFPLDNAWGLLFGELLTAQLFATVLRGTTEKSLEAELVRFFPDEVIVPAGKHGTVFQSFFKKHGYTTTIVSPLVPTMPEAEYATTWFEQQFSDATKKKITDTAALYQAVLLFYAYMDKNQRASLGQFQSITVYQPDDFLIFDAATQRNLELVKNIQDGGRRNTLFSVVDQAATPMGSRMVKKWLLRPLVKKDQIIQRQEAVAQFVTDQQIAHTLRQLLREMGDFERSVGRIMLSRAQVHDYLHLVRALALVPQVKQLLKKKRQVALWYLIDQALGDFSSLVNLLNAALNTDQTQPWIIKAGFDQRFDQLRDSIATAHQKIVTLEAEEQKRTGIGSLKIRYNQAHGYYIEVTKINLNAVPDDYQRKQTLVGKERFMTPALRELQHDIMTARAEIDQVEAAVFERVKQEVAQYATHVRKAAHALSNLDALLSFGTVSYAHRYVRPVFVDERMLAIKDGRHPVVEQAGTALAHSFIPNDTHLTVNESTWIITGPNMGGKSTYLRQVALITIMAQCGLFVPARSAQLTLVDRIFTRIGAGDNVAQGKSTFLVEMEETALICEQATEKSLVILDEVGRGTSTFDGLAIAQAVLEYLHATLRPFCLFATHYHELTQLQSHIPGMVSYYAASKKTQQGILFLYKIQRGVADGSFGVEVAKLAQLPREVIERAEDILVRLAHDEVSLCHKNQEEMPDCARLEEENKRLREQLSRLDQVDFDDLSPKKAFDLLWSFKEG